MNRGVKTAKAKFPEVQSVIGQYIRGEKSLQEIVHPSKLTKISRHELQVGQNRPVSRNQRAATLRGLKSDVSYSADPIITAIENEKDDDVDDVPFVHSNSLYKMGDSLVVRGMTLNDDTPIRLTSSSSSPPLPSASTPRLSHRSCTNFDHESTHIGSQAEQLAAMAAMTTAKRSTMDGHQNLNNLRQSIKTDRESIVANTCNSNSPRIPSTLRPPTPATIKDELDSTCRVRSNCRSVDFPPFMDKQFSGTCDLSQTTLLDDSLECCAETSDSSAIAENLEFLDFKIVSAERNEDNYETIELEVGKRYLEKRIDRQRAQIDELNDEIKKARLVCDNYDAATAKIDTKSEFESVFREFFNSSESWFRTNNISMVSSDSVIADYFMKCYDDLKKKVHQCDSQLKVSNVLIDNLEKDNTRLQNQIVKLKNVRTNGMKVVPLDVC